ncbi:NYN domain-containing protein [Thermomonas fusca]|uniref:NYN domain-containing protein n=1 Tax=Thermomonas fusca TaxID=215690 RepID=A0A5R9PIQ9_9GAMM|nr:NYN domain-containing protein [Thermomonas fusca]TLX22873.1 NYN domain-containing protein [Thermomonas fusca]
MVGKLSTAVYIDGYNLYYGRIRGTAHKWLDVVALFRALLNQQNPESALDRVHYFSAPALGRFATHGEMSTAAQNSYHRALQEINSESLTITLGAHSFDRDGTLLPRFESGKAFDRHDRVRVWKIEEKQTDVNIALAMYRDACSGRYQQLVVCSNDSDIAPALSAIKADFPTIRLGVVTPRHPPRLGAKSHRAVSSSLDRFSDWTRQYLLDEELEAAQLPTRIATTKKPIRKPEYW